MNQNDNETDGICILSLDNGGPGTYSQLFILKEYMSRMASDLQVSVDDVYPADYFDLMGGVGFGGLIAIMLGFLRMNVDEAIDALLDITSTVFQGDIQGTIKLEENSKTLKDGIESILHAKRVPLTTKINEETRTPTKCRVALYAATSTNLNHPHIFRTYPLRGSSLNPTIVEAICATMSMPSYFSSVKIGPPRRQKSFVGGAFGANNPTRLLLDEATMVYGKDRRVTRIFSLGCGLPRVFSMASSSEADIHTLLKDVAADCETVSHELSTRLFSIDAYVRLNVDRGMEEVRMEDWNELGGIESHTEAYIAKPGVSRVLESALRSMKERIASTTLGQLVHSSNIKAMAKQPPSVSPYFVARKKPWNMMVHHLTSASSEQKILPITGMGGCGKTQLVSYFLKQHSGLYKRVVYVDASSSSSIKTDLQTWARTLGDDHERDEWEDALRVLSSSLSGEKWALILDNADDPEISLTPFLPRNLDATILITSRNRDLGNLSTTHHLELGEMSNEEALEALLKAARRHLPLSGSEMQSAQTLIKELGGLAVALVQAGTYCYRLSSNVGHIFRPYTFTQYLSLFASHRSDLMKKAEPASLDTYKRGAYTTLDLSYNQIPEAPRGFLHLISFFHHTDIPLEAFATAANNGFKDKRFFLPRPDYHNDTILELKRILCNNSKWNELWMQEIIQTLQSFSLLTISSMDDSVFLSLHPLTQNWSRDMDPSASMGFKTMATQVLAASASEDNVKLNRSILPHIIDILSHTEPKDLHVNDLMTFAIILKEQGHYQKAGLLVHNALEVMEVSAGLESLATISVYSWLGYVYIYEGRYREAERLLETLLQKCKIMLGIEDPGTIVAAGNLAMAYYYQGRYGEAEELGAEVLEQRRRVLGMDHPDTINAAANLAMTYNHQGRYEEAEILGVELLQQRKRFLGMEHPDTVMAAANLALTYSYQGRYEKAEKLGIEVLEQRGRILGTEHPETIRAVAIMASTYHCQGKWNEAEELKTQVLEQLRRILGLEHPDTILAMANLAATYGKQGRWDDDAALLAPAVQLSLKVLGREHPDTQQRIKWLMYVYKRLGKEREAEEMRVLLLYM